MSLEDKGKLIPVNREAVRVLAMEIGARGAARSLKLNESTVLSWANRDDWKLPERNGQAACSLATQSKAHAPVAELLREHHKDLEEQGKLAISEAALKSAKAHGANDMPNAQALSYLANALGRVFQWSNGQQTVNVHADKAVIICDEGRLAEIREQRQRLLGDKVITSDNESKAKS